MASEFIKHSESIPLGITAGQGMDASVLLQSRWHRKNSCRNNSWSRDGCYHSCSKQMTSEFFKNCNRIADRKAVSQVKWQLMLSFLFKADGIGILQEFQQSYWQKSSQSSQVAIDAIVLVQSRWHRNSSRILTEFLTEKQLVKSSGNWCYHSCS